MSSDTFQQLFDENKIPVARTNIAGEYLTVNKAYESLIGYTLEELQALNYSDITPTKWHATELNYVLKEVFTRGEMAYQKEYIHKSGEIIAINAHIYLLKSEQESESGMWGTFEKLDEQ